jgi:hypothetical protein
MRRLIPITALTLFFLTVPLCAQRGGHMGGVHGGFAGAGRGPGAPHSFSGAPMRGGGHFSQGFRSGVSRGALRSSVPSRGYHSRGFSRNPYLYNGFHRRFRTYGFRNNCYGWRCRGYAAYSYPGWGWGYYDPWLWDWWNDDYRFDQDYNRNLAIANQMDQQSLADQRMLREEERDHDQHSNNQDFSSPSTPRRAQEQATTPISPTVLVFRDQHREEVRNYAIVGETLWNFAPQRTQKISLADLDLPATATANEDRGITFSVPGSSQGQ